MPKPRGSVTLTSKGMAVRSSAAGGDASFVRVALHTSALIAVTTLAPAMSQGAVARHVAGAAARASGMATREESLASSRT